MKMITPRGPQQRPVMKVEVSNLISKGRRWESLPSILQQQLKVGFSEGAEGPPFLLSASSKMLNLKTLIL
jgi:hypothetical protein